MIKEIIADYNEFKAFLKDWLFYKRHAIKLSLAMKLADIKQQAFNKRYFVVLIELKNGEKLVSINNSGKNSDLAKLKQKKWLPKNFSALDLEQGSFYQTSLSLNNKSSREEKEKAKKKYLKYAKQFLN